MVLVRKEMEKRNGKGEKGKREREKRNRNFINLFFLILSPKIKIGLQFSKMLLSTGEQAYTVLSSLWFVFFLSLPFILSSHVFFKLGNGKSEIEGSYSRTNCEKSPLPCPSGV